MSAPVTPSPSPEPGGERHTIDEAVLIPGTPIFGCPECGDVWESEPSCEHFDDGSVR